MTAPGQATVSLPPVHLAFDGPAAWQALAASPDPSAALVAMVRQVVADACTAYGKAAFAAGHGHAINTSLSHPRVLELMRKVHASGHASGRRLLSLDPESIKALAAAVAATPAPVVHVAPAPVTVQVPEPRPRRQIAVERADGSVLLEDVPA